MEIEGFEAITDIVFLAKRLHDIGRHDIIRHFPNELCWDNNFEAALTTLSMIFSDWHSNFDDDEQVETMVFEDELISDYFVRAWEYGQSHKQQYNNRPNGQQPKNLKAQKKRHYYDQNPYVVNARAEVAGLLSFSNCVDWKLLGHTKTKELAKKSKLIVHMYSCSCCCHDVMANRLIHIYSWFKDRQDEFLAGKTSEITALEGIAA